MIDFITDLFLKLVDLLLFIPRWIFDQLLTLIGDTIEAIEPPDFTTNYTINDYIPPDIVYFLDHSQFDVCLGIFSGAIIFYFLRRVLTLGIW